MTNFIKDTLDLFEDKFVAGKIWGSLCPKPKDIKQFLRDKLSEQAEEYEERITEISDMKVTCHHSDALEEQRKKLTLDEGKLKRSMIFDFIHILLWDYHSRKSYEKTWEHNRKRINLVEKEVQADIEKIAKAIVAYQQSKGE